MREYRCDVNKPFHFADDEFVGNLIATIILLVIFGGLFSMILVAKPVTEQDILPKTIAMITIAVLGAPMIIIGLTLSIKSFKERKKFKDILLNSIIMPAVVVSLNTSSGKYMKKTFNITLKIDETKEIVNVVSKSKHFWTNRKVAIAKYGEKQYILTRFSLIEE